ncbi:MAG TPA: chromosome segregation protein SMC [Steroidobacteraceae bacterium]|nr:chromosome segregation protein SMC [Steroidobacteraceae bacterium]
MRLARIKLAGFKSFVDPTTVAFPSNLTGVVGPNGCGKSNIIDAVRWVMGEISAKHLRGDSMTDVIFNGSRSRKPIGSGSVELVFDNSDGKLAGPYAGYAEVALKRLVSRDGNSTYFINGSKCRRKDITHLFLGTGLGSRSYAIIEQGMISRLIEARADDMRAFVEEAAGISRYKDRRRETENRISHTRENLERLNDLREEVDKQIRHLQRQAGVARRYQESMERKRQLQAELLALRIRDLDGDIAGRNALSGQRERESQSAIADLRAAEAAVERARARHMESSDALAAVQGRYYQAGADATRTEQALQHAREMRQRQRADLERIAAEHAESSQLVGRDREQLAELTRYLEQAEPELGAVQAKESAARNAFSGAEAAMASWQQQWESFSRESADATRGAQVEQARIEQIEAGLQRQKAQRERLAQEHSQLEGSISGARPDEFAAAEREARDRGREAQAELEGALASLHALRESERQGAAALDAAKARLESARSEFLTVEAVQKAALGKGDAGTAEWLAGQKLEASPRLAQQLEVEPGWERAVETALGSYLEAVCVDGIESLAGSLDRLGAGQLSVVEAGRSPDAKRDAGSLSARVSGPEAVGELLAGVMAVDSLPEAISRRKSLRPGQSVITRKGIWLGREWVRIARSEAGHAGVIAREQELRSLQQAVAAQESRVAEAEGDLAETRSRLAALDSRRDELHARVNSLHLDFVNVRGAHEAIRSKARQVADRLTRLVEEIAQLDADLARDSADAEGCRSRLAAALESQRGLQQRGPALEDERDALRERLVRARDAHARETGAAQQAVIKVESQRSTLATLRTSLERASEQSRQLESRRAEVERQLAEGEAPCVELERQLQAYLEQRLAVERELGDARRAVEDADAQVRELEVARQRAEGVAESARAALAEVSLGMQETRVRRESLVEQFAATHFDLEQVTGALPTEATVVAWDQQLAEVSERIERLGAVNLASIDELKEQSERKEYLDRQFADLSDALNTLEQAIRKIDRETRARFQDTFDRINSGLKEKFPRLFGGGAAYLELVGDDLLSAGVAVMARPPGKRNSTIHQLSGGEKALTAVALVFSIFELNPAPFCLLDEVDAPLDDNNVGRFCDIVRDMSERVQFVFITHNKNTMELASHLIGVTMGEPGVSRLVAVDVDEAVRMAAVG